MAESKIPFKTNLNQPIGTVESRRIQKERRIARLLAEKQRQINATRVNIPREKTRRVKWTLKWVLFLPLGVCVLMWVLVILIDLFKY
jgi:hypothetical protein